MKSISEEFEKFEEEEDSIKKGNINPDIPEKDSENIIDEKPDNIEELRMENKEEEEEEEEEIDKEVSTIEDKEKEVPHYDEQTEETDSTQQSFEQLLGLLANLNNQFEAKLKYDKHKDEVIDKLHEENQQLKNDLYKKLTIPFINGLIALIDDYNLLFINHKEIEIENFDKEQLINNREKLLKQFGYIVDDLDDLLNKNGVESFNTPSDSFNPSEQKIIEVISTDNEQLDKKIAKRIKKGFRFNGSIIRPEYVSCYKYEIIQKN